MLPVVIGDGLALVETISAFASHRISFDRDSSDSFAVTVDRLTSGPSGDVRKVDVLPLLPRGSRWNAAVGWRSFVVQPFELPGICDAAVGVEAVVPHPSRGAFPIMRTFLMHAESVSPALFQLAGALSAAVLAVGALGQRELVWSSAARTPPEHQHYEALMLSAIAGAWRRGERRLLRTIVLSDDQAPWTRSWPENVRALTTGGGPPYLVATVPPIREHFSRSTKLALLWNEFLE